MFALSNLASRAQIIAGYISRGMQEIINKF